MNVIVQAYQTDGTQPLGSNRCEADVGDVRISGVTRGDLAHTRQDKRPQRVLCRGGRKIHTVWLYKWWASQCVPADVRVHTPTHTPTPGRTCKHTMHRL